MIQSEKLLLVNGEIETIHVDGDICGCIYLHELESSMLASEIQYLCLLFSADLENVDGYPKRCKKCYKSEQTYIESETKL